MVKLDVATEMSLVEIGMKVGNSSSRAETGNLAYLVYEGASQYDPWLKLIVGSALALTLVGG